MTLDDLCARSGVTRYQMRQWMPNAYVKAPYLFLQPDDNARQWIERHYLPKFREHLPDLEIRTIQVAAKPPAKPTKFPIIKPGPWRDLLDSQE